MASQKTQDFHMAYDMHEQLNYLGVTENAISLEKGNTFYIQTLVDQALELIDPTPNIHTLFVQFNTRFFMSILSSVEVKWSKRMTSCAGICSFHRRNKQCVISLSAPLLQLRPRKDLVETLLHEMIHAYLFLTNNDRDRDAHGPKFCKHMNRINKEAGTNITIYHNFHDEVKLYRQHWWKCNGPCQYRPPFFGTVRRSMNRAPGPSDFWWREHQQNCNGQFIKIKEPENFVPRSKQNDKSKLVIQKNKKPNKSITDWFAKNTSVKDAIKPTSSKAFIHNDSKIFTQISNDMSNTSKDINGGANSFRAVNEKNTQDLSLGVKKLGSSSNNVHGWSISGPTEKIEKDKNIVSKNPTFSCSGVLGGTNSGRSNLLTKYLSLNDDESRRQLKPTKKNSLPELSFTVEQNLFNNPVLNPGLPRNDSVPCPICNVPMTLKNIYGHIDSCLINDNTSLIDEINNNINNNNNELILPMHTSHIPVTEQSVDVNMIGNKRVRLDDSNGVVEYVSCPVCNKMLLCTDINQHLDECLLEANNIHKAAIPSTSYSSYDSIVNLSSSSSSDLEDSVILIENPTSQLCASTSAGRSDAKNFEQKCLVCNAQISLEISLNEHLEECIGNVFNDDKIINDDDDEDDDNDNDNDDDDDDDDDNDNDNDDDDDGALVTEKNSVKTKYPCPVCMQIISENLMNQHLDMCLKNE